MFDRHEIERVRQVFADEMFTAKTVAERSTRLQALAKRGIFALHREDEGAAQALLTEARALRDELKQEFGAERLSEEGSWTAAEEELLEAELFHAFYEGRVVRGLPVEHPQTVIGALSDLLGEVARLIVRDVTRGSVARLSAAQGLVQEVMEILLQLDATGQARQKVDQARQHARKIEDVAYDLALRGRV